MKTKEWKNLENVGQSTIDMFSRCMSSEKNTNGTANTIYSVPTSIQKIVDNLLVCCHTVVVTKRVNK
jgi:hypothetical protein